MGGALTINMKRYISVDCFQFHHMKENCFCLLLLLLVVVVVLITYEARIVLADLVFNSVFYSALFLPI